jgi:hypothetical protein
MYELYELAQLPKLADNLFVETVFFCDAGCIGLLGYLGCMFDYGFLFVMFRDHFIFWSSCRQRRPGVKELLPGVYQGSKFDP